MDIPHLLADWMEGIPWAAPVKDFHAYWTEVFEGKRNPESFVPFGDGLHELAHIIQCKDEDLLDPYYGCGPVDNPYLSPTGKAAYEEIEVLVGHGVVRVAASRSHVHWTR